MVFMVANPFVPQVLVGREAELQQVCQVLLQDGDLLIAGVPGSGRHTLIRTAAQQIGARVLEIDCLRATNATRFLELLVEGLLDVFAAPDELALIQRWSIDKPLIFEQALARRPQLVWHTASQQEWSLFQLLLSLPQVMAEWLDCRVILVFQNFPHLRSWDRSRQWETYLQQEIQRQTRVSYALITTVPEDWTAEIPLHVIALGPLTAAELQPWLAQHLAAYGLTITPDGQALFHHYVQGHLGGAMALARRLWHDSRFPASLVGPLAEPGDSMAGSVADSVANSAANGAPPELIQPHHVHRSTLALVEDLSVTFESLILLLPPAQVRVLESLALDPTDSPHARDYIQKHQLSRGGGLQGALAGLEQKGLLYGPEHGYRIALPFLAFWLKHRLA